MIKTITMLISIIMMLINIIMMVMNLLPRPALNILSSLTSSPPRPSPVGESLLHHDDDDDDDGVGDDGHGDGDGDKQHKTMQSWKT